MAAKWPDVAPLNYLSNNDVEKVERRWVEAFGKTVPIYVATMKDGMEWRLRSVTQVLDAIAKPALKQWAADQACLAVREAVQFDERGTCVVTPGWLDAVLESARLAHYRTADKAAELGTMAHEIIERFLRDGLMPDLDGAPVEVQNSVTLFFDWWKTEGLSVAETELIVYDVRRGYAGTLDFLAVDREGKIALLDWKTSNDFYWDMELQVAAYLNALSQSGRGIPAWAAVVRIGKTDAAHEVHHVARERWRALFEVFQHLIHVSDAFRAAEQARSKMLAARKRAAEAAAKRPSREAVA